MFFFLITFGCSKKTDPASTVPVTPVAQKPTVDITPTFSFTANVEAVTDSSASVKLAITGAKATDVLKYSITLNGKTVVADQQSVNYIIKGLTSETAYQAKIDLKDQLGNIKSQSIDFKTAKYYLTFKKAYNITMDGYGECFVPTDDGYVISGYGPGDGNSFFFNEKITLTKIDKKGKEVWSNRFQYVNRYYTFLGHPRFMVCKTADGGFVINGSSAIVKVNSNGQKVWDYFFEIGGMRKMMVEGVTVNSDNTIVTCGQSDDGALICKFSADGKLLWKKNFFYYSGEFISATYIVETPDHGNFVVGEYHGTEKEGYGNKVYGAKLDKDGNLLWIKSLPQTGMNFAKTVKVSPEGNLVVLSYKYGDYHNYPQLTVVSTNGDIVNTLPFDATGDVSYNNFDFTPDGYVVCLQYSPPFASVNQYLVLLKLDKKGKTLWEKRYDTVYPKDVKYIDEGFVATGTLIVYNWPNRTSEVFIIKLNPDGNL